MADAEHGGIHAARALAASGIDTIYALPGGHILPLFEGARHEGIRIIDTRHEENAVLMALGRALATGDVGIAAVTAGPGLANAVPGIAEANGFGAPVVTIAGKTALRQHHRGAVQDLDQVQLVRSITKWQATCLQPERIQDFVNEAVYRARAGSPGPTFLDIPQDVFGEKTEPAARPFEFGYPEEIPRPAPRGEELERAVALLETAERPIVLAGGGAFWSGAEAALQTFSERTGIPVTTTSSARGLLPDDHPSCLGSLIHGGIALASADAVLILGSAFNANLLYGGLPLFQPGQTVIQVDLRPEAIGGNRRPEHAVAADIRTFLELATEGWPRSDGFGEWLERVREGAMNSRASWDRQAEEATERINPGWAAREVAGFAAGLGAHTIVCDGGDSLVWGLAFAQASGPGRHLFTGSALGTLGVGLPFAIAARTARPSEPVFLFTGDGAFGLSAMEMDTAARHSAPVVVVVANNGGWGDVRHEQRAFYGEEAEIGSILSTMRYDLLAEAVGGHGERVQNADDLVPALKRSLDSGKPAIVDVLTDPEIENELIRSIGTLDVM
ncbi:MAG: thiamine pyrophosphate-binding protein [Actinomycetota bacterium]